MAAVMPQQIVDPGARADAAHSLVATPRNAKEAGDVRQVQPAAAHPLAHFAQRGRRAQRVADPDPPAERGRDLRRLAALRPAQGHGNLDDHVFAACIACTACSLCSGLGDAIEHELTSGSARAGSTRRARVGEIPPLGEIASGLCRARNDPPRLHSAQLLVGLHVPLGDCAGADDAQADGDESCMI